MRLFSDILNKNPLVRWVKNARNRCLNSLFLKQAAETIQLPPDWRPEKHSAMCFSIAFNHPLCIEVLIESWQEFARNTELVIVDNSSKKEARAQIRDLCAKHGVPYIGLPPSWEWSVNRSHAISMNWIYYNLVLKWRPRLFGFLDHDCFPYAPFDLAETMGGFNIWGDKRAPKKGKNQWHLWAGFCFFRLSRLENVKIDFMHSVELRMDTGGSNWNSLYKYIHPEEVKCSLSGTVPRGELFSQMGNTIDNRFLHIGGASYRSKNFDKNNLAQALKEMALQNWPA